MVRLDAFRAMGGFDESLRIWEDGECFLRIGRAAGVIFVDAPIAGRRVGHSSLVTNLTGQAEIIAAYQHWYAAYRKHFGTLEFLALRLSRNPPSEAGMMRDIAYSAVEILRIPQRLCQIIISISKLVSGVRGANRPLATPSYRRA